MIKNWTFLPGWLAFEGRFNDIKQHKHHTIQICIPCSNDTFVTISENSLPLHSPVVINKDVNHSLKSSCCIVVLVEPESHIGQFIIDEVLNEGSFKKLAGMTYRQREHFNDSITRFLTQIAPNCCPKRHIDQRISELICRIEDYRTKADVGEVNLDWALSIVNLSKSRFLHLFSEEMGIPWRPYLLWQRLLMACKIILSGANATDAAHASGFSDSAHLSRTFKAQFGIQLSKVLISNDGR